MAYIPVWLKRICKVEVSESEMESINFPRLEYVRYMSFKTAEFLGIIGVIRGSYPDPFVRSYTRGAPVSLKTKVMIKEIAIAGRSWFLLGLLTGPFVAMFMMHGLKMSEIYKSCYRLRKDQSEIRRDRWAIIGGVSGATTGTISAFAFRFARGFTSGGIVGCSIGCLSALAFSTLFDEDPEIDSDSLEKGIDN